MRTFKILKISVPDHAIQVEMSPHEFQRLAEKEDWKPVLENDKELMYVESEPLVVYYAKKEEKPHV